MLAPAPKPEPTLAQLARDALETADGNVERATDALAKRLFNDNRLFKSLLRGLVTDAVAGRVERAMRNRRQQIMRAVRDPREGALAYVSGISAVLLDMPLAGGLRLRDATREQVADQAQRYEAQANDMGRKARWLTLIGQSLRDGQTVGQAIDESRAHELWQEAA